MALVQIEMSDVAELGTQVGMHGAIGMGEIQIDEIFELLVGIVLLVVEL
jgi:hypothetical protein